MTGVGTPAAEHTARERTAAVLAERAALLARPARVERKEAMVSLVAFTIRGVGHAVEASFVREVLRRPSLSRVPWAPPGLVGVANVRGDLLTVADIAPLVGLPTPRMPGPVVVIDGSGPALGFLVDEVHDFIDVPADSILPVPTNGGATSPSSGLLVGVTSYGVVLSAAALLDDPRLSTTEPRSGR